MIRAKERRNNLLWSVPEIDYYNELYEEVQFKKYIMSPCFLNKKRSKPEINFERLLDGDANILWWYKNGEKKENYFSVPYFDKRAKIDKPFYVDYIVMTIDGRIGLFDTKDGATALDSFAKNKSDGLQKYIVEKNKNGANLFGGIVASKRSGIYVFSEKDYTDNLDDPRWVTLEL